MQDPSILEISGGGNYVTLLKLDRFGDSFLMGDSWEEEMQRING